MSASERKVRPGFRTVENRPVNPLEYRHDQLSEVKERIRNGDLTDPLVMGFVVLHLPFCPSCRDDFLSFVNEQKDTRLGNKKG